MVGCALAMALTPKAFDVLHDLWFDDVLPCHVPHRPGVLPVIQLSTLRPRPLPKHYTIFTSPLRHVYDFAPAVCHTPSCAMWTPQDVHHASCTSGQRPGVVCTRSCGGYVYVREEKNL